MANLQYTCQSSWKQFLTFISHNIRHSVRVYAYVDTQICIQNWFLCEHQFLPKTLKAA